MHMKQRPSGSHRLLHRVTETQTEPAHSSQVEQASELMLYDSQQRQIVKQWPHNENLHCRTDGSCAG